MEPGERAARAFCRRIGITIDLAAFSHRKAMRDAIDAARNPRMMIGDGPRRRRCS